MAVIQESKYVRKIYNVLRKYGLRNSFSDYISVNYTTCANSDLNRLKFRNYFLENWEAKARTGTPEADGFYKPLFMAGIRRVLREESIGFPNSGTSNEILRTTPWL